MNNELTRQLTKDIINNRYGRPLVAALQICLELESAGEKNKEKIEILEGRKAPVQYRDFVQVGWQLAYKMVGNDEVHYAQCSLKESGDSNSEYLIRMLENCDTEIIIEPYPIYAIQIDCTKGY
jgi:hypothetical protein